MIEYVVGFLFSANLERVVLIRKNKPEWQKGKLNGVGGKIERHEFSLDAMVREFKEEAGAEIWGWTNVARLEVFDAANCGTVNIFFFAARGDYQVKSMEAEAVDWYSVKESMLGNYGVVPNLRWLLPLARQCVESQRQTQAGVLTLA